MKFFIDFETSAKQEITQMGCIDERGNKFHKYVSSSEHAPCYSFLLDNKVCTIDECFSAFYDYVAESLALDNSGKIEFYTWGACDRHYVKKAVKKISSHKARFIARFLCENVIDFHQEFCNKHGYKGMKLENMIKTINPSFKQSHNALEDAQFLQIAYLYSDIRSLFPIVEKKVKASKKKDPTNREKVKCKYESGVMVFIPDEFEMVFSTLEEAAKWIKRIEPENTMRISAICSQAARNIMGEKDVVFCGVHWKGLEQEVI